MRCPAIGRLAMGRPIAGCPTTGRPASGRPAVGGPGRRTAAALALLLAAAAGPPPEDQRMVPGRRAGFVADGAGGCWVWVGGIPGSAGPATARWTGACPDGPAEGGGRSDIAWTDAGRDRRMVFEGSLRRGKAEGPGRLTHFDDGRAVIVEEGEYRNDHFVGGRFAMPVLGLVYEGGWRSGQPQGQGRVSVGGRVLEGTWEEGCLRLPEGWVSFTRPARECGGPLG